MLIERLDKLADMVILNGNHPSPEAGMCSMEMVAWLAGEGHTDAPACACPVIAKAVIRLNDRIPWDDMRTELLRPLLPKIIGSKASRAVMVKRGYVAADMAVRMFAPMALEKRGRLDPAQRLRAVVEVTDRASAIKARDEACEVQKITDAYDAASAAASAAYAAAYAAAAAAAAADAAYAADAYAADAYAAASAASAAASAAAYAAAAAAYAADAAYDAAAYAAAYAAADAAYAADEMAVRRPVYEECVRMIERMLAITEATT